MIEEFVLNQINKHTERYNIQFNEKVKNEIIEGVKSGIYAFQVIYNSSGGVHTIILIKPLDWNKVIHNGQSLWSYDGGRQFKYSQMETLKLDIELIRDLKLNQILFVKG